MEFYLIGLLATTQGTDHIHRTHEDHHGNELTQSEYLMIVKIVNCHCDDRPGEFEDRGYMHGSRLQPTIIDIHRDESGRTGNEGEVHPLSIRRYTETHSPVRNQDEPDSDDTGRESESEHRDDFRMVIIQEVFREIGRCAPCSCSTKRVESSEDLLLSIGCHRDAMREGDEVSSNESKTDKEVGKFWNFFFPENHREPYCKNWLELLYQYRNREGDESNRSERHREEECSDHSWEERDREDWGFFFFREVCLFVCPQGKRCDDEKSENMLEEDECGRRKSIEWTADESIESPEGCSDDDEERSEVHMKDIELLDWCCWSGFFLRSYTWLIWFISFLCIRHPEWNDPFSVALRRTKGSRESETWILTQKGCTGYHSVQNDETRVLFR